jgi:hypothetical protein
MAGQSSNKGNPASHRMSNSKIKERRARSWLHGENRKTANRKLQETRERKNKELRAAGKPTAWQMAKQARFAKRHPLAAS